MIEYFLPVFSVVAAAIFIWLYFQLTIADKTHKNTYMAGCASLIIVSVLSVYDIVFPSNGW